VFAFARAAQPPRHAPPNCARNGSRMSRSLRHVPRSPADLLGTRESCCRYQAQRMSPGAPWPPGAAASGQSIWAVACDGLAHPSHVAMSGLSGTMARVVSKIRLLVSKAFNWALIEYSSCRFHANSRQIDASSHRSSIQIPYVATALVVQETTRYVESTRSSRILIRTWPKTSSNSTRPDTTCSTKVTTCSTEAAT